MKPSGNEKSGVEFEFFSIELKPIGNDTTNFNYKYTGQERDTFTNYDYMHFRFYASSIGRFLKPDNIIPDVFNPQSWNLYSYVNGNPVNFNDPSGHYGEDVHLDLTEVLAIAAGFSDVDASFIAIMDQGVDVKYPAGWLLYHYKNNVLYHFATDERIKELWAQFEETGSLEDLGTYLHAEQDSSYSHKGCFKSVGHFYMGTLPDKTYRIPERAFEMAQETYLILVKAAKVKGSNFEKKVEWRKISRFIWQFVKAKTKEEKKRILKETKRVIDEERKKKEEPKKVLPHKGKQPGREEVLFDKKGVTP